MSPFNFYDAEMYSDREEELQKLFAELAAEHEVSRREDWADTDPSGGTGDELPPILQDEVPGDDWDTWGEAA